MTPVSLNPPGPSFPLTDPTEDQIQLFISPNNLDSSNSLTCRSFLNILDQTQTRQIGELRHDQEEDGLVLHGGSSSHQVCNLSSNSQPVMDDRSNAYGYKVEEEESKSEYGSAKWMSSKMRLMRKMMTPSTSPVNVPHYVSNTTPTYKTLEHQKTQRSPPSHRNSTITRVCADCNTTSTPLWRGGPKGPKSLCNACGIRQRKARRAMAEAANGGVISSRGHNKEKKPRTNHFVQFKNKCKGTSSGGTSQTEKKNIDFKDFTFSLMKNSVVEKEFPRDEVAEAALLLMDLSCAFVPF